MTVYIVLTEGIKTMTDHMENKKKCEITQNMF